MIKIWVDDERPMPEGYDYWAKDVWDTLLMVGYVLGIDWFIEKQEILLDIDHDSGSHNPGGGDYINILKALERAVGNGWVLKEREIKVHFHSANPVGVKNMRAIVEKCPWMEEVKNETDN